ncbi:MAG: serine hydrolase [Pirellulaceae bacterium]
MCDDFSREILDLWDALMLKARFFSCLLVCSLLPSTARAAPQSSELPTDAQQKIVASDQGDLALIRQTLTDYIEGSTNGQPNRLRKVFHPQLNLYSIRGNKLQVWAGTDYINDTKEGLPTGEQGSILAIDFENNCAVAKVRIAPPRGASYVDYFMLLKIEGKWTIVHKMYTQENETAGVDGAWKHEKNPVKQKKPEQKQAASNPKIDSIFADYVGLDSPGVAVCVMKDGKVVHRNAYGAANLEHSVPIDAGASLFNIGSCSKQFTTFAILLLAEDGRLSLDDDVRKHIPQLPDLGHKITLRQLAHHTSGLRSELDVLAMSGWSPGDVIRRDHILQMLYRQEALNFEPGDDFSYCNSGYTLMAEVVARVTGQTFANFCQDRIFEPLEMKNSAFAEDLAPLRENMVYSYGRDATGFFPRFPNDSYSGSTGLWTTCDDVAKWVANFRQPKVGSPSTIREMESVGSLNNGQSTGYAMGLWVQSHNGTKHVHHSGGTASYVAYTSRFPEEDLSIVLLANTNVINAQDVSLKVVDVILGEAEPETDAQATEERAQLSHEALERFAGHYWNHKDRSINITREDDSLLYAIGGGPRLKLEPVGESRFRMIGNSVTTHVEFKPANDNRFEVSVVQDRGEVGHYFPYTPKTKSEDELQEYVGNYFSSELGTRYSVTLADGQLRVGHIRFQNNSLTPIENDAFSNNGWRFTTAIFERNTEDEVTGLRINSTRTSNIRFHRMP